jgi:hypothetical protein
MTTFVVAPEKPLGLHTHTQNLCAASRTGIAVQKNKVKHL